MTSPIFEADGHIIEAKLLSAQNQKEDYITLVGLWFDGFSPEVQTQVSILLGMSSQEIFRHRDNCLQVLKLNIQAERTNEVSADIATNLRKQLVDVNSYRETTEAV